MKTMVIAATLIVLAIAFATAVSEEVKLELELQCESTDPKVGTEWRDSPKECVTAVRGHVQQEVNAALHYLAMAAHFSRDTVNRPGFAKMFFEAASEEREHAMKLISYLLMRGEGALEVNGTKLIQTEVAIRVPEAKLTTGAMALEYALALETKVTQAIKGVIKTCEGTQSTKNDYHLVDYLTGEFLGEQYKGQRDIAGKVSSLKKFIKKHKALGEFLYDKKLLA